MASGPGRMASELESYLVQVFKGREKPLAGFQGARVHTLTVDCSAAQCPQDYAVREHKTSRLILARPASPITGHLGLLDI